MFFKYKALSYENQLYFDTKLLIENHKEAVEEDLEILMYNNSGLTDDDDIDDKNSYQTRKNSFESKIKYLDKVLAETEDNFNSAIKYINNTDMYGMLSRYKRIIYHSSKKEFILFINTLESSNIILSYFKESLTSNFLMSFIKINFIQTHKHLKSQTFSLSYNIKKVKKKNNPIFKRIKFLKKIDKISLLRTHAKYRHSKYFNFLQLFRRKILVCTNILIKKIPLSQRIVSRNNLEFFYKLKRFSKQKLSSLSVTDFLKKKFIVYLRDFHQKPYFKLRAARLVH
jgi:hypothetical protein